MTTNDLVPDVPLFLTPVEVSEAWGVSLRELRIMRAEGRGPQPIVFTSKTIWYWRIEVLAWSEKQNR